MKKREFCNEDLVRPACWAASPLLSLSAAAQAQAPTKAQQDAIRGNCRSDFMQQLLERDAGRARGAGMPDAEQGQGLRRLPGRAERDLGVRLPRSRAETRAEAEPRRSPSPPLRDRSRRRRRRPQPLRPPSRAKEPATKRKPAPKAVATPARPVLRPSPRQPRLQPSRRQRRRGSRATHQPKLGEAILIRRFCTTDFRVLCKGVPLGQGRAVQCLANNAPALSPGCRQAMTETGELRPSGRSLPAM